MTVHILRGDCREHMGAMPAEAFHAVVTSPPYWGLRDYGTPPLSWPAVDYSPLPGLPPLVHVPAMDAQLGLEPTLEAFIGHLVLVFREVRRVLRKDGTLWLNMGDSFAGGRRGGQGPRGNTLHSAQPEHSRAGMTASRRRDGEPIPRSDVIVPGLKLKDLVAQPWRLALALQADGWYLRQNIIWHKKNPMPESAPDRPTTAHEFLFLLSKSKRYYYDADAIKEPASEDTHARYARERTKQHKNAKVALVSGQKAQTIAQGFEHMRKPVAGWQDSKGSHSPLDHAREKEGRQGKLLEAIPGTGVGWGHGTDAEKRGRGRVKDREVSERMGRGPGWRKNAADRDAKNNASFDAAMRDMPDMVNKRTVWSLATEPFKEAHFATFPTKLVEPCVLAGVPPGGTVYDPFGGSGTVGVVADGLGRNAVLSELKPGYARMADRRVHGPLFACEGTHG